MNKFKIIFSKSLITLFVFLVFLHSCTMFKKSEEIKNSEETPKKQRIEPNVRKRMEMNSGIIWSNKRGGSANFATSNPLWRASLEVLEFMPLDNASYSGGIIVTDWYGEKIQDQIKITIKFNSNEVKVNSFDVISHKKKCDINGNCVVSKGNSNLESKIKDRIITKARELKILAENKK